MLERVPDSLQLLTAELPFLIIIKLERMVSMKNYGKAEGKTNYHSAVMLLLNRHRENAAKPLITDKCHREWREYLKIQWFQPKWLMHYTFN
jgi:hypothetical protein